MSIAEILLLLFFLGGFFSFAVFAMIDQWKRTQAYNGMMEQLQESICSISNDFSFFVGEYAYNLSEGKRSNSHDTHPGQEI